MEQNKTKKIIIVLSSLLMISLVALSGMLIYNKLAVNTNTTVAVPDNLITPDEDNNESTKDDLADESTNTFTSEKKENSSSEVVTTSSENLKQAIAIALYNKQPQDNIAFSVGNMFPGDSENNYYNVRVSYHDKVTVHFKADVRVGYEKLSEVMNVRVTLLNTGEIMYDGLMRDMPDGVTYELTSHESITDDLYYEITAYLDTTVGNEYQNQDLVADFKWWIEETENLDKAPQTGDNLNIILQSMMAIFAVLCIILFVFRRKEEDMQNG